MEPYYYQTLSKAEQSSYQAMQAGLQAFAPSFPVPLLENRALTDVFMKLRLDCPQLFYAGTFQYRYYPDSRNAELIPAYLFEKGKLKEHQKALQARVEKLVRPVAKCGDEEKLLYIHDFICENIHYDKLKKPYSHEIIGPLGQGVGVCEGIAKSVKVLCDALGVWCVIAICGNNPEKGIKYRHTWNIVRIGGQYYHLDATFDNTLGKHQGNAEAPGEIRYDYFNLGDKAVFRDHEPLIAPAPGCPDNDHFYYKEKKLSFTKTEEVYKRAQQMAKKGRAMTFQWRGGYLTREVLQELLELIRKAGEERQKTARISFNWPQAVIHFSYVENAGIPEPEVVMEDANEGEQFDTGE